MKLLFTSIFAACLFILSCKNSAADNTATGTPATTTELPSTTNPNSEINTNPSTAPTMTTTATNPTIENKPNITTVPVTGQPTVNAQPTPQPKAEPAQNAQGVWHYTCPKGCKGGGGAAGPCGKCGSTLAHNAAYHGPQQQAQPTAGNVTVPATATSSTTPKVEPPQNAKGVWHYTCSKGCAGGAGSATACAKCGATLAHNAAYHQ